MPTGSIPWSWIKQDDYEGQAGGNRYRMELGEVFSNRMIKNATLINMRVLSVLKGINYMAKKR